MIIKNELLSKSCIYSHEQDAQMRDDSRKTVALTELTKNVVPSFLLLNPLLKAGFHLLRSILLDFRAEYKHYKIMYHLVVGSVAIGTGSTR